MGEEVKRRKEGTIGTAGNMETQTVMENEPAQEDATLYQSAGARRD
jgi:hypothetical protein